MKIYNESLSKKVAWKSYKGRRSNGVLLEKRELCFSFVPFSRGMKKRLKFTGKVIIIIIIISKNRTLNTIFNWRRRRGKKKRRM